MDDENHVVTGQDQAPGSGSGVHSMPSSRLLSRSQIEDKIDDLAQEIDEHYKLEPFTMLVVMDGAMFFAARLSRALRGPHWIESIKCKSYRGGKIGSSLKITGTPDLELLQDEVLVVEDIIDSGRTIMNLMTVLPDARVVTLIERAHHDPVANWIGFKIGPGFIYGYGLDDDRGWGRGLKDIWVRGVDLGRSR